MVSSPPHTGLTGFDDSVPADSRPPLPPTPVATVRIDQLAVYRVPQAYPEPPELTPAAKNHQKFQKIAKNRKKILRGAKKTRKKHFSDTKSSSSGGVIGLFSKVIFSLAPKHDQRSEVYVSMCAGS